MNQQNYTRYVITKHSSEKQTSLEWCSVDQSILISAAVPVNKSPLEVPNYSVLWFLYLQYEDIIISPIWMSNVDVKVKCF